MSRKKIIGLSFVALLAVSWLLYAWYEFIYKKSITHINSDIKNADMDAVNEAQLAPEILYGSKRLALDSSIYLRDEWQETVFLPKWIAEKDEAKKITEWLINPQQASNLTEKLVKKAELFTQGDSFILYNGAKINDHIELVNATSKVQWDDLIIQADMNDNQTPNSIMLIKNTNDKNYIIENNDNWFTEWLYTIRKKSYSAFMIWWNNDISNVSLSHENENQKHNIGMSTYQSSNYGWYGYEPTNVSVNNVAIPSEKKITISLDSLWPITKPTVYHIEYDEEKKEWASYKNTLAAELLTKTKVTTTAPLDTVLSYKVLEPDAKKSYSFTTTKAPHQWILIVTNAHFNWIPIQTDIPYTATLEKQSTDYEPYGMRAQSRYGIDPRSLNSELERVLGKEAFNMSRWTYFTYKIQPKKEYKGTLKLKNIFWQTTDVPLELYIDSIDSRSITKEVLANNTISILPNNWSFQDVLIQHMNVWSFPVTFQACTYKKSMNYRQGGWLENQLFDCDGKIYTQQITTKDFVYRKWYRTAVSLPVDFPKNTAFKVSVPDSWKNWNADSQHVFIKSDIWIRTKISDKKAYIRPILFENNESIVWWDITLTKIDGSIITTKKSIKWATVFQLPTNKDWTLINAPLLVKVSYNGSESFVIIHPFGYGDIRREDQSKSFSINSLLNPSEVVNSFSNIDFRGSTQTTKIYGYSDRWLYKAGEEIFYAGFVRDLMNFTNLDYLQGGTVSVRIDDVEWNSIYSSPALPLDEFWWFNGSAKIPTTLSLWDAIITYTYSKNTDVSYSHNIKIKEYKKPTFFADISFEEKDNDIYLNIKPQYFFGQNVGSFDANVTRSLAGKDSCAYCRWWNEDEYYYNFTFNDTISNWWKFVLYNQKTLSSKLFAKDILEQKWYNYTLKAEVAIRDLASDEVQFFTKYIDFAPAVKLGLNGQPYDRLYNDWSKDPTKNKIEWEIQWDKNSIASLEYEVYYWSYDTSTEKWIDGNLYYLNGQEYSKVGWWKIDSRNKFEITTDFITNAWSYFIRVFAKDANNTIVWEVQKQIEYYKANDSANWLLWALPNNYSLTVSIPKKTFEEWEKIPVDILPYQKGAKVIMTVERWDRIIDVVETTLDGNQLSLTAKKWYAPNIVISVIQVAWTNKSQWARKEPRFFAWFGQATISTKMHEMNIDIKTDKESYKPWEKVKMTITTTDKNGKAIDTRLSIGVIDEALIRLYDIIKEPIPYFFNKMRTSVYNYTNMKLLYQSLRAFANNGSKWWAGNGWQAMFSMIRDDLLDTAFWRGWVQTKDGKIELEFTLPDNLTTWVIDVIGISKDTKLGTARKSFLSTKNLVVEPNAPQFMTLWDKIDIPVKMIVAPKLIDGNKKITWSAKITNDVWDSIDLWWFSSAPNSKIIIPVELPKTWNDSAFITLTVQGKYNSEEDGMEVVIPIRSEWLIAKDSIGIINTAWEHTFSIPENYGSTVNVALSTLPTNLIDPILKDIIIPRIWGTEEIASSIQTIKAAFDLQKNSTFKSKRIEWNIITTEAWKKNIQNLINDKITTILNRQQSNGSFGRWDNTDTPQNNSKYVLSTYVYSALLATKDMSRNQNTLNNAITKLEQYLYTYRTSSESAYMRYLSQKSAAWKWFTADEIKTMNALNPLKTPYWWLLRYAIASYQKDTENTNKRRQFATIPTNQDRNQESMFINQVSAHALKLSAIMGDPASSQDDRMKAMQNLLSTRSKSGIRGNSIENTQALKALLSVNNTNRPSKESIACMVSVWDKKHNVTVKRDQPVLISEKLQWKDIATSWTCDSQLIADIIVSYMPTKLDDLLWANQHVTQMNYSITELNQNIWETTSLVWEFTTTLAWQQAVASMYLPATYVFVDTLVASNEIPFEVSDERCIPNHRETRFDKVLFYYDRLPPISCSMSIQILKAYQWSTSIMPMTVAEMYKGTINGRKVILAK